MISIAHLYCTYGQEIILQCFDIGLEVFLHFHGEDFYLENELNQIAISAPGY